MKRLFPFGLALLIAVTMGLESAAQSRDSRDSDQERARRAFELGEILPITEILAIVARYLPGDVIEVDLDVSRDGINYEVDVLTPTGRVVEITIDARTGTVTDIDD